MASCSPKKDTSAQDLINGDGTGKPPVLTFKATDFNFGTVAAGAVVKHGFKFYNKGEGTLIIQNASASCGCTVPTYPKNAIAPGDSGEITVEFNSEGRSGSQHKTITILANANPPTQELTLTGEVQAAPEEGPVAQ